MPPLQVLDYSPTEETLSVRTPDGMRYEFFDVKAQTHSGLLIAANQTEYFNEFIWNKHEHRANWASLEELLAYMRESLVFDDLLSANSVRSDGDTPLHIACLWGDVRAVELLLIAGADIEAKGDHRCTPLYEAVSFENERCAKLLLSLGASPDAENQLDTTPREAALSSENPRIRALFPSEA
jgi:ankyrin repeat protein